jgi:hypothetical protein
VTWAIGGSFATPNRALNLVNADGSEEVRLCAGDTSNVDSIILNGTGLDVVRSATNSYAPILIKGCDASGSPYNGSGYAMLEDISDSGAYGFQSTLYNFYTVQDLHFYNLAGLGGQEFNTGSCWRVLHCKVDNCDGGFLAGGLSTFVDCTTVNISSYYGFQDRSQYVRCQALWTVGTNAVGFYINCTTSYHSTSIDDCLVHGCNYQGIRLVNTSSSTGLVTIKNCTLDGCATGIQVDYGFNNAIILVNNCILSNNSSYGILSNSGSSGMVIDGNHFYSNGTDTSGLLFSDANSTSGDPQFIDRAGHDFHIARSSPAARFRGLNLYSYAGCYVPYMKKLVHTG